MAYVSGKDCYAIYFDSLDVKSSQNELKITREENIPQRRPIGSASKTSFRTGQYDGALTLSGWLDSTTRPQVTDLTGDAKVISVLHEGNAISLRTFNIQSANVAGVTLGTSEDDLDTLEPLIVADGLVQYGYVVAPYAARTTAGNTDTTYATLLAAPAASHAYLHVVALALGGYTNCIVTVRHSDGSAFADHTAFTAVTAVGAQCIPLATTLNTHVSVSWAWTGAGTGQSIGFVVCVAPD